VIDWFWDNIGWFLLAFIVLLVAAIVIGGVSEEDEHHRLVAQCMADRHPEWWCEAQLQQPRHDTTVMPMPIYIPSGK